MAKNFYAVKNGRSCGIYTDWESCKAQVTGFKGAVFKGFETREEAEAFLNGPGGGYGGSGSKPQSTGTAHGGSNSTGSRNSSSETLIVEGKLSPGGAASKYPAEGYEADASEDIFNLEEDSAIAYVDGSFDAGSGIFSCGVVLFANTDGLSIYHIGKNSDDTDLASMRNVAGEITGSMEAMKKSLELGIKQLTIYHDYEGIAAWCLGRWKTNKEGTKAYKAFYDEMSEKMHIDFVKVKGHSGDTYNELADSLAKKALKSEPFNIRVQ